MKSVAKRLTTLLLATTFLVSQSGQIAMADETATHPAIGYSIDQIIEVSKGPYKPGDLIAFDIKTNLERSNFHYFQVTGECFSAPASWHTGTENKFVDNSYVRQGFAVAVITSGCTDGIHQVLEVELEDSTQGYARIAYDGINSILNFQTIQGQLFAGADNSQRKVDSISTKSLSTKLKMNSVKPLRVWGLPAMTLNRQTINWVANGVCKFRKARGAADVTGDLIALKPGKCYLSANTPWGSNLFQPVNIAQEILVYSHKALLCENKRNKKQQYVEKHKCPKGYVKK